MEELRTENEKLKMEVSSMTLFFVAICSLNCFIII